MKIENNKTITTIIIINTSLKTEECFKWISYSQKYLK